jgi:hypothetical protein
VLCPLVVLLYVSLLPSIVFFLSYHQSLLDIPERNFTQEGQAEKEICPPSHTQAKKERNQESSLLSLYHPTKEI